MIRVKIGKKEYPLMLNMSAMEEVEQTFGGMKQMYESMNDDAQRIWTTMEVMKILVNGGLAAEGKPNVSHEMLAANVMPHQLAGITVQLKNAMEQGMYAQTKNELDDEEHDEVLEEIEKKTADK